MALTQQEIKNIFETEFYPHLNELYNFGYRLTYNEDDANDLVQDTFLKAIRFIEGYEVGTNARAWLYRILKNSFINNYRKKIKEPSKSDFNELEQIINSEDKQISQTVDLRTEIFQNMLGDEITNALNSLSVDFRIIIMLCDLEGFTYEEISKIIDIPIGTVRSRLHRGRQLLKEKLADYAKTKGFNK